MDRRESERLMDDWRELAADPNFVNRHVPGAMVKQIIEAHYIICGEPVREQGTPHRAAQPIRRPRS